MKKSLIVSGLIISIVLYSSCTNKKTQAAQDASTVAAHHPEDENLASLSDAQISTIGIEYGSIEQKELSNSIRANGRLKVPNQNKAFVTPVISGIIRTLAIEPGSFVRQGQAIATIYNPSLYEMQQQLHQLNIEISLSEKEVERQRELVEGNAAPLKKLQQVQTALATLKSQREGMKKQLSGMGASEQFSSNVVIKAPITGTVSRVEAQIGSNVDGSRPIAEIVNNSQLHLDLFIYERDFPKLKLNQQIHFTITNNPVKEYDATIFSLGSAFESGSKTIPIHAAIKGDKTGLIDGMNITALISLNKSTLPAVPASAIVAEGANDFIFIVENDAGSAGHQSVVFRKVGVVKGTTDIGYSEITPLENIPDNAKVVTKGAFFIMAKMTNTGDHDD